VKELKDMFSVCAPIFNTITRDKETARVRSIKPGEDVETMWESLDQTAKAWRWSPDDPGLSDMDEDIDGAFVCTYHHGSTCIRQLHTVKEGPLDVIQQY
jgi:hypothetical protein